MTTNGVNFQKAVDYCLLNGATVQESAAKFGVDMAQLSEFITKAMNPKGGGEVGDQIEISNHIANKEIAHAQVKIGTKEYTVSVVGAKGEQGASAKIYDKDGNIVPFSQFDKDYAFSVDDDGRINMKLKPGSKAPTAKVTQETDGKGNWFDTFANFWRKGNKNAVEGKAYEVGSAVADDVVIVANRTNTAPAGAPNGVDNGVATKTMDDVYAQYALDKPQADKAEDAVKNAFAKMSPEDKKQATDIANAVIAKAEAGDTKGAQEEASKLDKFMGDVFGGLGLIDLPEEAKVALLVVGIAGLAYAAAEAGVAAVTSKVAQRAAAVFAAMGLTSCSGDDGIGGKTEINQNVNITITQNSSLEDALDALIEGQKVQTEILQKILEREIENGMTAKEILDLCGGNAQLLAKILDSMTENNNLLKEVKNSINSGTENIMNALVDIKGSVDTIADLIKEFPEYTTQLNEIISGIKTGNKSMSEMKDLIEQVLNQAVKNGDTQVSILNKLNEIQNANKSDGEKLADMLKLLGEIKVTLDGIAGDLKAHFKNDATVNKYLEQILAEAKKNNAKTDATNELLQKLYTLVEKLGSKGDAMGKEIINAIANLGLDMTANFDKLLDAVNNGNVKLDDITALLQKINANVVKNGEDGKKLGDQILNYIAAVGFETNQNFSKLLDAVNNGNVKLDDITALLQKINANVVKNGEDGKKLGDQILNYIAAVGFETNQNFSKLLDAVNNGNVKLDDIKELITQLTTQVKQNGEDGKKLGKEILDAINKLGVDMNTNFTAVLEAINKGVAGADSLRDLLEKVLEKQGKNTKAIIDAIGNIKVGSGGTVDLSSIEKMLAELLKQSQKNGNILSNIDAKTDVIATTTKSILAALNKEFGKNDERYKNINNLLTVIANKNDGKGNDKVLLEKLDKILQKLDEIKDAIKNHKVEVDVTGKVTCECNCGSKHEGILGDLNNLLG